MHQSEEEEQVFHIVCRVSRLMCVCEENRSEIQQVKSVMGTRMFCVSDFVFCSGEKMDKGKSTQELSILFP